MNGGTWDPPFPISTAPAPPGAGWEDALGDLLDTGATELRRRLGIPDEPEPYVAPPAPAPQRAGFGIPTAGVNPMVALAVGGLLLAVVAGSRR